MPKGIFLQKEIITMNFDKYEGFLEGLMTEQDFYVKSMRLYESGTVISENNEYNKCVLTVRRSEITGKDVYKVFFENEIGHKILNPDVEFDKGIAYHDRISFCNLPSITNIESPAFKLMSSVIGFTRRGPQDFSSNEPYILNLFSIKNNIMRISFTYYQPERVLEFDVDYDMNRISREQTKPQLLSLMLHRVLELGHSTISYPEMIRHVKEGFNTVLDIEQMDSILFTLNTIRPNSFEKGLSMQGMMINILADKSGLEEIITKLH